MEYQEIPISLKDIDPGRLYKAADLSIVLDLHYTTIIRLMRKKEIPCTTIGKHRRVLGEDLISYIMNSKVR